MADKKRCEEMNKKKKKRKKYDAILFMAQIISNYPSMAQKKEKNKIN